MIPKAARARLQNIKISKYLETHRLTEDVFGEFGRKPWRGDTPHAREPLTMSKIENYGDFWFPYKNCRGDHIPCENYSALPWFLVTVQKLLWRPITVQQLPCITVVAAYRTEYSVVANYRPPITVQYRGGCYRGKRYRDEKPLPRKALKISGNVG